MIGISKSRIIRLTLVTLFFLFSFFFALTSWSKDDESIQALIKQLNDSEVYNRKSAVNAIGKMGPSAIEAVPVLVGIL